jgi:hypothetical protein
MSITIRFDHDEPLAIAELVVRNQPGQHQLEKMEAKTPRDLEPVLVSQPFKLLLEEVRAVLAHEIEDTSLEIIEVKGTAFPDAKTYRPGISLMLRDRGAARDEKMSEPARKLVTKVAETLREELSLS